MTRASLAVSERRGGAFSPARSTRELAARTSDGVSVRLLWHPPENAVTVSVEDFHDGERFDLAVAPERALDPFYHPYAYAA
jgi:hypothetical protein